MKGINTRVSMTEGHTNGAVIGSRSFVDEAFVKSRIRFGAKRKSGARKMKGGAAGCMLWSLRDLRKGTG
jgi:hypothetical protein